MSDQSPLKHGKWAIPESLYWSAIRKKAEAEKREKEGANAYDQHTRNEAKDGQITFRISRSDIAKLKMIAHGKKRRYQAYLRDVLKREIEREVLKEEAGAAAKAPGRARRPT